MQQYLPVQVGRDGAHSCLQPFLNNKKAAVENTEIHLARAKEKVVLEAEKANFETSIVEIK